jgi:hypothetical protein
METNAPNIPGSQYGLPAPGNRPRHPELQQLLNARAPVFVKNDAGVLVQFTYRPSPGSTTGKEYLIPQTLAPFQIHLSPEQIQSASDLYYLIGQEKLLLLWPDEVKLTEEDRDEIQDAIRYARNPNQEGYAWSPNRDENVEIIEDPDMAQRAAGIRKHNPRVIVLMKDLTEGKKGAGKILRELIALGSQITLQDISLVLSSLHNSGNEGEERIRNWAQARREHLARTAPQGGQPASDAQKAALEGYAKRQREETLAGSSPPSMKQGRQVQIPEAQLRSRGKVQADG